jgi:hypothetical protein
LGFFNIRHEIGTWQDYFYVEFPIYSPPKSLEFVNMFRLFFVACLNTIITFSIYAQDGARNLAMGSVFVGQADLFGGVQNRAGYALHKKAQFGFAATNRFTLNELTTGALAGSFPLKRGSTAFVLKTSGNQWYRSSHIVLGYALPLGPDFAMGVSMRYHHVQLGENLGNSGVWIPEVGMHYRLTGELAVGILLENPLLVSHNATFETNTTAGARFGVSYTINTVLQIGIQGNVLLSDSFSLQTGLEYAPKKKFALRMGFDGRNRTLSLGMGFLLGRMSLDFSATMHQRLGISPGITFCYPGND